MFRDLLPEMIELAESYDTSLEPELFDEERQAIVDAVASRRKEFSVGRDCARRALLRLGVKPVPIPIGPERSPLWPRGFVGSITHCQGYCCAIVARSEQFSFVGIDAERLDWSHEMVPSDFLCPSELDWIASRPTNDLPWGIIFFSLKEALYKAWYPAHRCYLDFHDVELSLLSPDVPGMVTARPSGSINLRSLSKESLARFLDAVQIRYTVDSDLVCSAVWG
ncbi:4'-phosphopantetheinyl transferase family protein [Pirellulaceae bacterium SH501]